MREVNEGKAGRGQEGKERRGRSKRWMKERQRKVVYRKDGRDNSRGGKKCKRETEGMWKEEERMGRASWPEWRVKEEK